MEKNPNIIFFIFTDSYKIHLHLIQKHLNFLVIKFYFLRIKNYNLFKSNMILLIFNFAVNFLKKEIKKILDF